MSDKPYLPWTTQCHRRWGGARSRTAQGLGGCDTGAGTAPRVLEIVSIREAEHAAVFRKRLCELGYDVRQTPSATFDDDLALARSAASDEEKFARLIGAEIDAASNDPLSRLFDDPTIDPQTGALLGRFIAEERDSERRLRAARQALKPIR